MQSTLDNQLDGEKRLSDVLLRESAHAELFFTHRMQPDFGADEPGTAIADLGPRDQRIGGRGGAVPEAAAADLAGASR